MRYATEDWIPVEYSWLFRPVALVYSCYVR